MEVIAYLQAGGEGVRQRGKGEPGDNTMLDAPLPALDAMRADGLDRAGAPDGAGALATALELLPDDKRPHVHLCPGPIVERAVEAVSLGAAGATVEEILRGAAPETAAGPEESIEITLTDPLGLHARPAASVVRAARRF